MVWVASLLNNSRRLIVQAKCTLAFMSFDFGLDGIANVASACATCTLTYVVHKYTQQRRRPE